MIPYGRQSITDEDIDSVVKVLKSDFLTQGPQAPKFEKEISKYCDAKYAVAVNSATSALHIACLSLSLSKEDWLWTSPITFLASANCGLYCGAKIDFIDIDPKTYNICIKTLKNKLINAKKLGRLPKIVIPVHLAGQSCDMKSIYRLSKEFGFKVIEDASHAIGGQYLKNPIGNCKYSDITVFSFHPVKIITSGEGGMAVTNNKKLANSMTLFRSHGATRDPSQMNGKKTDGGWYYQQIKLGFNYRMTDIQAALGISQFKKLNFNVKRRHELADRYSKILVDLPLKLPYQDKDSYSSFHLYIIRLKNRSKEEHKQFFENLRKRGIGVNLHYIPIYRQPFFKFKKSEYKNFPQSEAYYSEAISIPLYPSMTNQDQDKVIKVIKELILKLPLSQQ